MNKKFENIESNGSNIESINNNKNKGIFFKIKFDFFHINII